MRVLNWAVQGTGYTSVLNWEAQVESDRVCAIRDVSSMHEAARRLHALGPRWVLLKGGEMQGTR